jgi:hypothetical protein
MRYFEAAHSELACIAPSPLRGEGWGEGLGPLSKHELVLRTSRPRQERQHGTGIASGLDPLLFGGEDAALVNRRRDR